MGLIALNCSVNDVKGILQGIKIHARKPVKSGAEFHGGFSNDEDKFYLSASPSLDPAFSWYEKSPFGYPGAVLIVREPWYSTTWTDEPNRGNQRIVWKADDVNYPVARWKPAITMPFYASRLGLLVKRVWIENLQDISDEDCIKEGLFTSMIQTSTMNSTQKQKLYRANYDALGTEPEFHSPKEALEYKWDLKYSRTEYCWSNDPLVFGTEFEITWNLSKGYYYGSH